MAEMDIRGSQIQPGTVTDNEISASAGIQLSKLAEAVVQADGGQAFTANQSMGGFRLVNLGTPTAGNDAVNKTYVDDLVAARAAGLDPKENVRASSTAAVTLATGVENADSFGGITLVTGDRILLMHQAAPEENGIWVVAASGAPSRAADSDGTPTNEVTLGNYVFVTQGTNAGKGFWLYSSNATSPETQIVPGTDTQLWQQFNAGSSYTASNGITLASSDFQLNFSGLSTATVATGDSLPFADVSDSGNEKTTTVANLLADLDIPNNITADGLVARTAADTYTSRSIAAGEGLAVTNGNAVSGNPTLALDFLTGLSTLSGPTVTGDLLAIYDVSATAHRKYSLGSVLNDLDIPNGFTANGLLTRTAADTYASRTLTAGAGIAISNGDGVSGNPTVALDINGLTADSIVSTDLLVFYDTSGTDTNKITLANFEAALTLDNIGGTLGTAKGGTGISIAPSAIADGDLLIGSNTGDAFVRAQLTGGTGISITPGAGSITISLTESGMVSEADFVTDDFTGDGTTTVFNLTGTAAAATNSLIHAWVQGIRQKFTTHFTATTTAVTFSQAPANGDLIQISYITA